MRDRKASDMASDNETKSPQLITFEDGVITLGGEEVPGILQSLSVDGKVRFDEQKVDGVSGKKKTPQGYEDCEITVAVYLVTDADTSCYEKLEALSGMFRKVDDKANPQIYDVANRHLLARGVRQVVFSKLQTAENDATDEITASLGFTEHNPPIIRMEEAQARMPTAKELARKAVEKVSGNEPPRPNADSGIADDESIKIDVG